MKRLLPIVLIVVLLGIASAAILWAMKPREPVAITALPAFDYADDASWAERPNEPPPAVWESGWDIDVVLLSAGAATAPGESETAEKRLATSNKDLRQLAGAFDSIGPVYAPMARARVATEDIAAALAYYLDFDNRGRAFVIATDAALPADFPAMLAADPLLRDRFAGVLVFADSPAAGFPPETDHMQVCSRRYESEGSCTLEIDLRRFGGNYSIAGDGPPGGALVSGFTAWLRNNSSKLAEPLGELEEIEIIEIQKPTENP